MDVAGLGHGAAAAAAALCTHRVKGSNTFPFVSTSRVCMNTWLCCFVCLRWSLAVLQHASAQWPGRAAQKHTWMMFLKRAEIEDLVERYADCLLRHLTTICHIVKKYL
jgi:hypothetical protein